MPLPRGGGVSDMPQRLCRHSTHSRSTSSESGGIQPLSRHSVGSPKFGDRRALKETIPEKTGVNHELQKKSGSRISDLESQLGQVHDEVKKLKEQLASVQTAKKEANLELEENRKQVSADQTAAPDDVGEPKDPANDFPEPPETPPEKEKTCLTKQDDELSTEDDNLDLPDAVDNSTKVNELTKEETEEKSEVSINVAVTLPQQEGEGANAESKDNIEVAELKAKMQKKVLELIGLSGENEILKIRLLEVEELKTKEEETSNRLNQVTMELEESNKKAARVAAQLEVVIQAKAELEEEMKRVRVQTEQWRKAAEIAASVLAYVDNGAEMNRRSGSMNRQNKSSYNGLGSPLTDDTMEETSVEKKRKGSGSGIKKIGDLWKKKGQK